MDVAQEASSSLVVCFVPDKIIPDGQALPDEAWQGVHPNIIITFVIRLHRAQKPRLPDGGHQCQILIASMDSLMSEYIVILLQVHPSHADTRIQKRDHGFLRPDSPVKDTFGTIECEDAKEREPAKKIELMRVWHLVCCQSANCDRVEVLGTVDVGHQSVRWRSFWTSKWDHGCFWRIEETR